MAGGTWRHMTPCKGLQKKNRARLEDKGEVAEPRLAGYTQSALTQNPLWITGCSVPCNACQMVPNDPACFANSVRSDWERHYSMYFDLEKMTVTIDNRSVALGTCRLAHSLFLAFSRIKSVRLVWSEWERHYSICFDIGKLTVPVENRSVALGFFRIFPACDWKTKRRWNDVCIRCEQGKINKSREIYSQEEKSVKRTVPA